MWIWLAYCSFWGKKMSESDKQVPWETFSMLSTFHTLHILIKNKYIRYCCKVIRRDFNECVMKKKRKRYFVSVTNLIIVYIYAPDLITKTDIELFINKHYATALSDLDRHWKTKFSFSHFTVSRRAGFKRFAHLDQIRPHHNTMQRLVLEMLK